MVPMAWDAIQNVCCTFQLVAMLGVKICLLPYHNLENELIAIKNHTLSINQNG